MYPLSRAFVLEMSQIPCFSGNHKSHVIILLLPLVLPFCGSDLSPIATKWREMAEMERSYYDWGLPRGQGSYLNIREQLCPHHFQEE